MSFISTLSIDYHNFGDGAITEETVAFNEKMQAMLNTGPKWFEVRVPAQLMHHCPFLQ